jgi:GntR family transcriptional regulator
MSLRHQEISDSLRAEIADGTYPEGSVLPPESELAARHGVSRGTVRQALATLNQQGLIGSRQGARRQVLRAEPAQSFTELRSFSQWALAHGHRPTGRVVSSLRRPATLAEAASLQVAPGAETLHVVRLRHLDGLPVLVERTTWAPWVADLVDALPDDCPSVTLALERHGVCFAQADHVIDAIAAGTLEADLLGVRRGGPLLRHRRVTSTPTNLPIEAADDRYRGEAYSFSLHNSTSANPLNRNTREVDRPSVD